MLSILTQPPVHPACYVPKFQPAASLLFNGAALLARIPSVTGHRRAWTWAGLAWIGGDPQEQPLFQAGGANDAIDLSINGDNLYLRHYSGGSNLWYVRGSAALRDGAGWYHVIAAYDSDNPVVGDRVRLFINGQRVTALSTATMPSAAADCPHVNVAGTVHWIGRRIITPQAQYLRGLLCDVHFIDGQALDAAAFGEVNIHGVWVPKAAAVADYGVNGFLLDFADPLNPGKDISGQGNHWTASGFDAAGGDVVGGTPVNVFCMLNPLWEQAGIISGGGLIAEATVSKGIGGLGTIGFKSDDQIYFEIEVQVYAVANGSSLYPGIREFSGNYYGFYDNAYNGTRGRKYSPAGQEAYSGNPINPGDIISVVYKAGELRFWLNGVDQGVAFSGLSTATRFYPWLDGNNHPGNRLKGNFGQRPFAYTPPAGFKTLCTDNITEPEVKDPADAFIQATATGANLPAVLDAAAAHWNGAGYIEIVKRRDAVESWRWRFSDDPGNAWASDTNAAKAAAPALAAAGTYMGYRLRVGAKYGVFAAEIVHTTGTATTVPHGLATARAVVIATRVSVGGGDRFWYHPDLPAGQLLKLNGTAVGAADTSITAFGADSFQIGAAMPSGTYRVVVLAERDGLFACGKYQGLNNVNGPFLPGNVAAELVMIRRRDVAGSNIVVHDATRNPVNPVDKALRLNSDVAEITIATSADFVVGGVKIRSVATSDTNDVNNYVWMMWGCPIGGICVAPATAR